VIDLIEVLKQRLAESGFDLGPSPANDLSPTNDTAERKSTPQSSPRRPRSNDSSKPGPRKAALRDPEQTTAPRKAAAAANKAPARGTAPRRGAKKATRVKRAAH
jgi:hypothetical protein